MSLPSEISKAIFRASLDGDANKVLSLIGTSKELLHTETPFGTPLHMAAARGDMHLVMALVEIGADINRRGGTFNGSAINDAASKGQREIVTYLIERNAELDVQEPERNPLWGAIYAGNLEIVRLLVAAGIDHTVRYTGESMTNMGALDFAIERGQNVIADFLQTLPSSLANRSLLTPPLR